MRSKTAFSLFSQCHNLYNKNCITEQEKSTLGKFRSIHNMHALPIITHGFYYSRIHQLFRLYGFPGMKKTVKMHLLEHHVSEWVDMYNAGFGLMGEQGTKAIHYHFNQLYRTYGSMANKVQRLMCIMQEHYLSVCPRLKSEKLSRKRKRK